MLQPYPEAELSIYNSGSIRIDDVLPAGDITVYDIIRVLPFGGNVQLAAIKGDLLLKLLDQGQAQIGSGSYLQSANTQYINKSWYINNTLIDLNKTYKLAINDYLTSGKEQGLNYFAPNSNRKDFVLIDKGEKHDIRQLVIDQLKNN